MSFYNVHVLASEFGQAATVAAFAPWSCCASAPGSITNPSQLRETPIEWIPAATPGTVAGALRDAGRWDEQHPPAIDTQDWWYRSTINVPNAGDGFPAYLCFDGLATIAEIWLNGQRVLTTDNMFREYRVEVTALLQAENELAICFSSLSEDLKAKRPRPRWKTNLVNDQQLRWRRASLLGRIPGWTPPVPAIGPWRDVWLESGPVLISDVQLSTAVEGAQGVVHFTARIQSLEPLIEARLAAGAHEALVEILSSPEGVQLQCILRVSDVTLWWPHTHGAPALYPCELTLVTVKESNLSVSLGKVGFRQIEARTNSGFALVVNGAPVYCRGACWTTSDIFVLDGKEASLRLDLQLARDAGVNMLRIGGTMAYESECFYRLCDELGILVWQDFMFANMDYPVEDTAFAANIETEARQQLQRFKAHPCMAVYCGNSEIEQQAAMLGMPRELWRNTWFAERLPRLCAEIHPATPYVPSTPSGGVLPFHTAAGIAHFYGIGAYRRTPAELRQAHVKFTPECLGFSNIPENDLLDSIMGGLHPVTHHPRWKQRVPRDTGAGWDFEDVRDFYLQYLYGLDPAALRSFNPSRYLQLGRVATGEMMAQTFAEWRGGHGQNSGGLVWFYKDLWPAAGWGIVDSRGVPKAAYYQLRRVWQNRQVTITDEGLDGLHVHLINETAETMDAVLEVVLLKEPKTIVTRHEVSCRLPPRSRETRSVDEIVGSFFDVSYAYRFGPPHHDVVMATLFDIERQVISESFHDIHRKEPALLGAVEIESCADMHTDNSCSVTLHADVFLRNVSLTAKGFLPDDNYFHLLPSRPKTVRFARQSEQKGAFKVKLEALNLDGDRMISFKQ